MYFLQLYFKFQKVRVLIILMYFVAIKAEGQVQVHEETQGAVFKDTKDSICSLWRATSKQEVAASVKIE